MSEHVLWTADEYGTDELDVDVGSLGGWVFDLRQEYFDDVVDGAEYELPLSPANMLPKPNQHQHQHQTVTSEESEREHGWIIKTLLGPQGTPYAVINFPQDKRAQATDEYLRAFHLCRGIPAMENLVRYYETERDDFETADELRAEVADLRDNDEETNKQIFAEAAVEGKAMEDTKQHKIWRQLVPMSLLDDEHIRLNRSSGESKDFKAISNNCQDLCLDFY